MAIYRGTSNPIPSSPPQDNVLRTDEAVPGNVIIKPVNITAPILSGNKAVGSTLTATPGVWQNPGTINISKGFYRDDVLIPGTDDLLYVVIDADALKTITYKETATNIAGSTVSGSNGIVIEGVPVPVPTPPPAPTPSPPPAGATFFNFASGVLPAGVSVSRSTTATFIDSLGKVVTAAVNAARFDYTLDGDLRGLMVEKPANNVLLQSNSIAIGSSWAAVGSPVVTPNFAVAPDGTMTASRVQLPAGSAANIVRQGVAINTATHHYAAIWARPRSGSSANIMMRDPASNSLLEVSMDANWNIIGFHGISVSTFFNFDIASSGATVDIEIWGGQLQPQGDWFTPSTIINTGTTTVSRAVEKIVFTVPSGTYDLELTFENGVVDYVYDVVSTGTFTLDPVIHSLNGSRLVTAEFGPPGSAPPPPPPPPPPAPSGSLILNRVFDNMDSKNDLVAGGLPRPYSWNVDPSSSAKPGCTIQGVDSRGSILPQWAYDWVNSMGEGAYLDNDKWPIYLPWMVIYPSSSHNVTGIRAHTRNHQIWGLRKSDEQWVRLQHTNSHSWFKAAKMGVLQTFDYGASDVRNESEGGNSVLIGPEPREYVEHGITGTFSLTDTDWYFLLHACQGRLVPHTTADASKLTLADIGMNMGADWIVHANQQARPGANTSRIMRLTGNWQWYTSCPFRDLGRLETNSPNTVAYPASMMIAKPPPFSQM